MQYLAKCVHFDVVWPNKEKNVYYMATGSHSNEEWERLMDWWLREEDPSRPPKPILDLDEIYKDGKLFGYTVIHVDDEKGAIARVRVEQTGHKYIVSFKFDWENFELRIEAHPSGQDAFMRFCHPLDSLFNLKGGLAEMAVKDTIHRIITEFEKRDINNI